MALGYGRVGTNQFACAKFIVDTNGLDEGATHTTIAGALTDASSGDTIFIKPGTYTENITLKAGVNLAAFACDSYGQQVEIVGKVSASYNGTAELYGIALQTNSDYCLDVTGANTTVLNLNYCRIFGDDNTAINVNAASSDIRFLDCFMTTSSQILITLQAAGGVDFQHCEVKSANGTSTISASSLNIHNSKIQDIPFSVSGTGALRCYNSSLSADNATFLTSSSSAENWIFNCNVNTGTAAAFSISGGATVILSNVDILSTNANPITGAGTAKYGDISFSGSGDTSNITTYTGLNEHHGPISFDGGSNYLDYYEEGTWTPALQGSTGNPTVTYTTQTGNYIRFGDMVYVTCDCNVNTYSGGSGDLRMAGLPFNAASTDYAGRGVVRLTGVNLDNATMDVVVSPASGAAYVTIECIKDTAAYYTLQTSDVGASDRLMIGLMYFV